jgi:hypothetical protein
VFTRLKKNSMAGLDAGAPERFAQALHERVSRADSNISKPQ